MRGRLEYAYVCIYDVSRIAFAEIFPNEKAISAIDFQSCRRLLCKPWRQGHAGDDGQWGPLISLRNSPKRRLPGRRFCILPLHIEADISFPYAGFLPAEIGRIVGSGK